MQRIFEESIIDALAARDNIVIILPIISY